MSLSPCETWASATSAHASASRTGSVSASAASRGAGGQGLEVGVEERVDGLLQRRQVVEPGARGVVPAQQVLARGGGARQLGIRGIERERLGEHGERAGVVTGGGERVRERDEDREPVGRLEPERGGVPAGGGGGWRARGGFDERGDRLLVAALGAVLEVARLGRTIAEHRRGALVRREPPALAGGAVDGAPDDRAAEAVAARTGLARRSPAATTSSSASSAAASDSSAAAAATSSSAGSPATAAPNASRRAGSDSASSSWPIAAAIAFVLRLARASR